MKIILLLLLFPIVLSSQITQEALIGYDQLRTIDRHLKTMINMDIELDSLRTDRLRLKLQLDNFVDRLDEKDVTIEKQSDIIDDLRLRNTALVDTSNHYKILDYGKGIHIADLNNLVIHPMTEENKNLNKQNKKLVFILGALLGSGTTAAIFLAL